MRLVLAGVFLLCGIGCSASEWASKLSNDPGDHGAFVGGRGLVTSEGPAGLFINPTSGTAPKGTFTAQTCVAIFNKGLAAGGPPDVDGTFVGNKTILTYAIEDWLEVGATSLDIQNDRGDPSIGPHVRARLLKEEEGSLRPEVGVGYYSYETQSSAVNPPLADRRVLFLAVSKDIPLPNRAEEKKFVQSARVHAGVRETWRENAGDATDFVGYWGAEVGLPYHTYFIAELQTDESTNPRTPFAFGVQVRHPAGVAFTVGGMQPGFSNDIGLYVGIGIGFSW